jgi:hypothetical protein
MRRGEKAGLRTKEKGIQQAGTWKANQGLVKGITLNIDQKREKGSAKAGLL